MYTYCKLPSHTEVGQLGVTLIVEKYVACFDVSVNFAPRMQVLQTFQCVVQDGGDLSLV
jgi:hypothetical protein